MDIHVQLEGSLNTKRFVSVFEDKMNSFFMLISKNMGQKAQLCDRGNSLVDQYKMWYSE